MTSSRLFFHRDDTASVFAAQRKNGISEFFPRLQLRTHGRLLPDKRLDIDLEGVLFNKFRVLSAVGMILFVVFNFTIIIFGWGLAVSLKKANVKWEFVPVGSMSWHKDYDKLHTIILLVHTVELLGMMFYLYCMLRIIAVFSLLNIGGSRAVWIARYILCSPGDLEDYQPWLRLYYGVCHCMQTMTNFSTMKTMRYWNPQFFYNDFALIMAATSSTTLGVLMFIIQHIVLGFIGFVAFCTKFSHVVDIINEQRRERGDNWVMWQVFALAGLANQMFGITLIWRVEENRVLLFMFGGADAVMEREELARQDAFIAEATRVICQDMYKDCSGFVRFFKRTVALLGLRHFDFQSFVLEQTEASPNNYPGKRIQPVEEPYTSHLRELSVDREVPQLACRDVG